MPFRHPRVRVFVHHESHHKGGHEDYDTLNNFADIDSVHASFIEECEGGVNTLLALLAGMKFVMSL